MGGALALSLAAACLPATAGAGGLRMVNDSSLTLSQANESPRAVALCPGSRVPYGGSMHANPDPDQLGEGVYPHNYERLGAQGGFHTAPVLYDSNTKTTRSYVVTLQVLCGLKPGKLADPHDISLDIPSGQSRTLVARCPKRSVLIGGGFQRAAFQFEGGVYVTSSHAISKTEWETTGTAFGTIRNDFVSIGYCMASPKRKPLLQETTSSVTIAPRQVGFTTTPPCPAGRRLVWNGFDTNPRQSLFFADGIIDDVNDTFTASAYNKSGAPATLTAYGYCLKTKVINGSLKHFSKKVGSLDKNTKTKADQDGNPNG